MDTLAKGLNKLRRVDRGVADVSEGLAALKRLRTNEFSVDALSHGAGSRIPVDVIQPISHVLRTLIDDVEFVRFTGGNIGQSYRPLSKTVVDIDGNAPLDNIAHHLRRGDLDYVIDRYRNVPVENRSSVVDGLVNDYLDKVEVKEVFKKLAVENFPDHEFDRIMSANEASLKNVLTGNEDVLNRKIRTDLPYGGLDHLYRTNKKFRKLINNLQSLPRKSGGGRRYITFKGVFVTLTVGVGLYALFSHIVENAKRMAGCWRIYTTRSGELVTCKLVQCSCAHVEVQVKNTCNNLPRSFHNSICKGWPSELMDVKEPDRRQCRRCDINAPKNSLQYLPIEDMIDPKDIYVCKDTPNIGTLLSDIITELPKQVWDGMTDTVGVLLYVFEFCCVFVLGGIFIAIVMKLIDVYEKFDGGNGNDKNAHADSIAGNDITGNRIKEAG